MTRFLEDLANLRFLGVILFTLAMLFTLATLFAMAIGFTPWLLLR